MSRRKSLYMLTYLRKFPSPKLGKGRIRLHDCMKATNMTQNSLHCCIEADKASSHGNLTENIKEKLTILSDLNGKHRKLFVWPILQLVSAAAEFPHAEHKPGQGKVDDKECGIITQVNPFVSPRKTEEIKDGGAAHPQWIGCFVLVDHERPPAPPHKINVCRRGQNACSRQQLAMGANMQAWCDYAASTKCTLVPKSYIPWYR